MFRAYIFFISIIKAEKLIRVDLMKCVQQTNIPQLKCIKRAVERAKCIRFLANAGFNSCIELMTAARKIISINYVFMILTFKHICILTNIIHTHTPHQFRLNFG